MTSPNRNQGESLDVDAAQARCDAATEGPWNAYPDQAGDSYGPQRFDVGSADGAWDVASGGPVEDGGPWVGACSQADAEFISHARSDLPAALAEVRVLRARVAELEATLASEREAHLDAIRNDGRVTYCPRSCW